MVEVQPAPPHAKKAGGGQADDWLWRCGWRCFSCTTAMVSCCSCDRCAGAGASRRERVQFWLGIACLAVGVALGLLWPQILSWVVQSELRLSPRSMSFQVWRATPVPLRIDFYFWNWTNPHEVEDPASRPRFEQMGPYSFIETKEKVNITWHDANSTVSFRQLRRWFFDAAHSNGSLSDNVTTINVVGLTAAHVVRDWHFLVQRSVSLALLSTRQGISVTRTAGQFLFEGFDDPLISVASKVPGLAGIDIPDFDKFGWFYMRNGSTAYDGHFNMHTGASDIGHLGELERWNHRNVTPFYEGSCGHLRGSAGELWPPGRSTEESISLFAPDLCRSVTLDFVRWMEEAGVAGLRYEGGARMLDNGVLDAANECFCDGECVPGGVSNVSACRYGSPAFVSFPHFHLADPSYRAAVQGMRPDAEKHAFYIAMEPTYGIPLDVAARFQINLLVQRNKDIDMLSRVPERLMFPVIWFEQRASITPELATPLRLLLHLPAALLGVAGVLFLAGLACVGVPRVLDRRRRRQQRDNARKLVASFVVKREDANGHLSAASPTTAPRDESEACSQARCLVVAQDGAASPGSGASGDADQPLLLQRPEASVGEGREGGGGEPGSGTSSSLATSTEPDLRNTASSVEQGKLPDEEGSPPGASPGPPLDVRPSEPTSS